MGIYKHKKMIKLEINRGASDGNMTYGMFIDKGVAFAVCLELPWRNNKQNKSCIPAGIYHCKRRTWGKYKGYFEIMNVPGRTGIIIHTGICDKHTLGCPLVGELFERFYYKNHWWNGILKSRKGFNEFMSKVKDVDEFELEIRDSIRKDPVIPQLKDGPLKADWMGYPYT